MIPFRDANPSHRFPIVTVTIIAANVLAFFYQLSLSPPQLEAFIWHYGFVPAYFIGALDIPHAGLLQSALVSMFLHGGWLHLIGNMWYLWIFGDNIEDRLGHFKFILFYLTAGLAATAAHFLMNLGSALPSIGASGAIAAVLGAYMVTFPHARILTLLPFFFIWQIVELPALLVLGFWFVIQFLSGLGDVTQRMMTAQEAGGVAWWAHIGGFVAGILLIKLMGAKRQQRRRPYSYYDYE